METSLHRLQETGHLGQQRPGYSTFQLEWTAITAWNEATLNQFKQLSKTTTCTQNFTFFMMLITPDHFMESNTSDKFLIFSYCYFCTAGNFVFGTGVAETCLFSNLKVLLSSLRLLQNCCFYALLKRQDRMRLT